MGSTFKNLFYIQRCGGCPEEKCFSVCLNFENNKKPIALEKGNQKAAKFCDILWLAKLAYLASIFDRLDEVNLSLQGKEGDIFLAISKIDALKLKILF